MKRKRPVIEGIVKGRFSLLLISFALAFFVLPLVPAGRGLGRLVTLFGLVVLLSCLRTITRRRGFFAFMVGFSLLNVLLGGAEILDLVESFGLTVAVLVFKLIYYLLVFGGIMGYVISPSPVTGNKIAGAVSAYVIMGMIWATIYALFYHFSPESIALPSAQDTDPAHQELWPIYFSFTTLTTLGYGDILPCSVAARSYAVMEAACGQIFLAVLIARLVALQVVNIEEDDS